MSKCDYCKDEGCKYCRPAQLDPSYPIKLVDRKPPTDPLTSFYGTIRDAARLTDNITLARRIAVLDVVRAELVRDFQAKIDEAEE